MHLVSSAARVSRPVSPVEHSNSGKKFSIRFTNLINLPLLHWYSNSNDGEFGEGPGGVSLRCGLFCAISVSVRQFPNKLKTSKVLNAANNDVSWFFGWDYTINKQEKTAWQLVNRRPIFLLNESIRIDSHNESNRIDSNRELECSRRDGQLHDVSFWFSVHV